MEEFDRIAAEQGWNKASTLAVLRDFVEEQGLGEALAAKARQVQAEENSVRWPD